MQDSHDADLQHFARGKNGVAVRVPAKHSAEHARGDGEIRGAEKNPRDADRGVSDQTEQKLDRERFGPCFVSRRDAREDVRSPDKSRAANPRRQKSRPRHARVRRGT